MGVLAPTNLLTKACNGIVLHTCAFLGVAGVAVLSWAHEFSGFKHLTETERTIALHF